MTLGVVVLVVSVAPGIPRMTAPHDEFSSSSSVYDSHIIYIYIKYIIYHMIPGTVPVLSPRQIQAFFL